MVSLLVDAHYRIVMSAIYRYRYIYTHTAHSGVVFTPLCVIRRKAFKGPNDFCGHFPFLHCFIRGVYIRNGTESRELHAGCFSLQFLSDTLISIYADTYDAKFTVGRTLPVSANMPRVACRLFQSSHPLRYFNIHLHRYFRCTNLPFAELCRFQRIF